MTVDRWRWLAGVAMLAGSSGATAQEVPASKPDDIVVTGKHVPGSVIGDAAPVAVLDTEAMKALGATKVSEMLKLLKPLTTSTSGANPVFLLNGRRISGDSEIWSLPDEALERTEILPETEASRFGFPPTVRIVNFITKAHFRALSAEHTVGTTTEGGASTANLEVGATRIDKSRRTTLVVGYDRQDPLNNARRAIGPDTGNLFDVTGNITGVGGGRINPALDALAGGVPVTVAAVPVDPAQRGTLAAYAAGANRPSITNLAPYQSVASRDALKVDGTQAMPLGKALMASVNLTMEAQRGAGIVGLPTALLRVPAGNSAAPFANDVLLYRYATEAGVLRQQTQSLNLHAGGAVQGTVKRWLWAVTGAYDRSRAGATVDRGIDTTRAQAAIDAGADPFGPLPVATVDRLVSRNRTVTGTLTGKATASGPVVRLPAGEAQMTLTGDLARSTGSGTASGATDPLRGFSRTTRGASVSVDVPIASAAQGVLDTIGSLTANGTIGISAVSDYGSLTSRNLGLVWSPVERVQITGSSNLAQAAPAITLLTNPAILYPNAAFFDFTTGTNALVTLTSGGNPALGPERRRIDTLGVSVQPIKDKELRFTVNYIETRIDGQVGYLSSVTPALQAAFPGRFLRDTDGRLIAVDTRPINLARERERKLELRWSLFTQIGPEPKPPATTTPPPKTAPPPPPPKPRPMVYSFVTTTIRLDDRLMLTPGQPMLDLLAGDSIGGSGGRSRYEISGNLGGSYGPVRTGIFVQWQNATRIRSDIAASDLRFSGKTIVYAYANLDAARLMPKTVWTKNLMLSLNVQNLFNDRIAVRDRNGVTPYRFQPAFLDPYGRTVRLTVRKLF